MYGFIRDKFLIKFKIRSVHCMNCVKSFRFSLTSLCLCRVDSLVPKTYFVHREFSFTLKDDVYLRYQSFADQQELEKEILKRNPYKIDIGAVFTHKVPSSVFSAFSSLCNVTSVSFLTS